MAKNLIILIFYGILEKIKIYLALNLKIFFFINFKRL
jgi:hypothetical protein